MQHSYLFPAFKFSQQILSVTVVIYYGRRFLAEQGLMTRLLFYKGSVWADHRPQQIEAC
jgi:hypothetical protein